MAPRTTPRKNADSAGDDRFEMTQDGKCRLTVGGTTIRFRRPKFGEFRQLREMLYERDDESLRLTAAATDKAKQLRMAAGIPEDQAKVDPAVVESDASSAERLGVALDIRTAMRELDNRVLDLNVAWVQAALDMLREDEVDEVPDPSEWPPEMSESPFLKDLIEHWRHRPLAPGGGANPTS